MSNLQIPQDINAKALVQKASIMGIGVLSDDQEKSIFDAEHQIKGAQQEVRTADGKITEANQDKTKAEGDQADAKSQAEKGEGDKHNAPTVESSNKKRTDAASISSGAQQDTQNMNASKQQMQQQEQASDASIEGNSSQLGSIENQMDQIAQQALANQANKSESEEQPAADTTVMATSTPTKAQDNEQKDGEDVPEGKEISAKKAPEVKANDENTEGATDEDPMSDGTGSGTRSAYSLSTAGQLEEEAKEGKTSPEEPSTYTPAPKVNLPEQNPVREQVAQAETQLSSAEQTVHANESITSTPAAAPTSDQAVYQPTQYTPYMQMPMMAAPMMPMAPMMPAMPSFTGSMDPSQSLAAIQQLGGQAQQINTGALQQQQQFIQGAEQQDQTAEQIQAQDEQSQGTLATIENYAQAGADLGSKLDMTGLVVSGVGTGVKVAGGTLTVTGGTTSVLGTTITGIGAGITAIGAPLCALFGIGVPITGAGGTTSAGGVTTTGTGATLTSTGGTLVKTGSMVEKTGKVIRTAGDALGTVSNATLTVTNAAQGDITGAITSAIETAYYAKSFKSGLPQKTQDKITAQTDKIKQKAGEYADKLKEAMPESVQKAGEKVSNGVSSIKEKVTAKKDKVVEKVSAQKDKVAEKISESTKSIKEPEIVTKTKEKFAQLKDNIAQGRANAEAYERELAEVKKKVETEMTAKRAATEVKGKKNVAKS